MAVPWLVLRPQPEADVLVAALRSRGVNALATPAIERIAVPLPRAEENAISTARGAARRVVALLTSAAAVPLVAGPLLSGSPGALDATDFGALEPTTADAARAAGLSLSFSAAGGAVELARACAHWIRASAMTGRPLVVHPTSDTGLAQEEGRALEEILSPLADLLRFSLYETRAHPLFAETLRALAPGGAHYVVTSPSTVSALAAIPHPRAHAVLCRGRSTVDAWRAAFPTGPVPTLVDRDASLEDAIAQYDSERKS